MNRILATIGAGRLIGVALTAGIIIGALIAVPLFASANDGADEPDDATESSSLAQLLGEFDSSALRALVDDAAEPESRYGFAANGPDGLRIEGSFSDAGDAHGSLTFEAVFGDDDEVRLAGDLLDTVAELTGTDPDDVVAALREGQTLAAFAAEHGVSEDALLDALMSEADERLNQAVTDGDLSQEEADRIRTELSEHLGALINGEGPFGGFGSGHPGPPGAFPFVGGLGGHFGFEADPLATVAELTGTETDAVIAALEGGQTLAEFAADNGVSEDELVAALMADAGERIAEAVADGDLSQEEADDLLAMLEEHTRDMVNGTGFGLRHHDGPGASGGFGPFGGIHAPGECDDTDGGDDSDAETTANEI